MSAFVIAALVLFVGWHVLRIRERGVPVAHLTLLRLLVESSEKDELELPVKSAYLRKKVTLTVALTPGMELEAHGAPVAWKVARSVLTDNLLVVFLQTVKVPSGEVDGYAKGLVRNGWEIDG
jgi:hypothetical protein